MRKNSNASGCVALAANHCAMTGVAPAGMDVADGGGVDMEKQSSVFQEPMGMGAKEHQGWRDGPADKDYPVGAARNDFIYLF